jgi:hypothetical protein
MDQPFNHKWFRAQNIPPYVHFAQHKYCANKATATIIKPPLHMEVETWSTNTPSQGCEKPTDQPSHRSKGKAGGGLGHGHSPPNIQQKHTQSWDVKISYGGSEQLAPNPPRQQRQEAL